MIKSVANQNGFTYILALTVVVIMGIMLGMVGQSWKTLKQREQEKELIFRGSQIKEAIENWNNPKYTVPGVQPRPRHPLMDLKDLLQDPYSLSKMRFLPHHYATELDDTNPKCAPDCAKLKIYQDPMTGKEWTIIRGSINAQSGSVIPAPPGSQGGGIIGIASKSDETPFRADFKGTALENMGTLAIATAPAATGNVPQTPVAGLALKDSATEPPGVGGKMTKYSQWQFIADPKNDHTKIYNAYHEGW